MIDFDYKRKEKVKNRMFNNKYRYLIVFLLICAVSLIIEFFICNANAFRIKNNGLYELRTYTLMNLVIEGADIDAENGTITYRKDYGGSVFITLNDIETNIGTVYMDLEIPNGVLKYVVAYTDETNESFYRSFEREYVAGVYKTKWFTCHLRGESRQLTIRIDNLEDGYTFRLNQILINEPVPLDISWVRLIVILVMISFLYGLRRTIFFQMQEKIWIHNALLCLVSAGFILLAVLLYTHSFSEAKLNLMYNADFVDALIKGQLHLDIEVSEALKALDNPYDTSMRQTQGVEYSWDTAYYNGKYYCYYGVVPVLLFFVPYKLITGAYLQCNIVVIIAYCLYILLLDLVSIKILRHCMPKVPFGIEFTGLILLNSAASIFFYVAEPTFYLVPYAVGMLFVASGFVFFTFWYTGKRSNAFLLFMGAVCLALSVGCRPPMLFYTILIIPFGIKVIKEKGKACISDMVVLVIPYVIIGSALALYNYLRFDSIIEFGQTYQLTAQDQLHNTHTLYEVPVLLWLGLFQPLNFSAVFPFVSSGNPIHNYAGNFYIGNAIIPLFSGLPILFIMFSPTIWKKWLKNTDKFSGRMLPFTAALGMIIMTMVFVNAGVECRYSSEFAPIMCIVAILLFSNFIQNAQTESVVVSMTILFVLAVYSFLVSLFSGISGEHGYMLIYHPEFYYGIERLFCFWK